MDSAKCSSPAEPQLTEVSSMERLRSAATRVRHSSSAVAEMQRWRRDFAGLQAKLSTYLEGNVHDDSYETMFLLLENRSYGYPYTDGTLWSNYKGYVLNRHPLISIWTVHPLHPFTSKERVVCLFCSFCWGCAVNALLSVDPIATWGIAWQYSLIALLILPYEVLIRVLVICPCCHTRTAGCGKADTPCAQTCRKTWIWTGWGTAMLITFTHLMWLLYALSQLWDDRAPDCNDAAGAGDDAEENELGSRNAYDASCGQTETRQWSIAWAQFVGTKALSLVLWFAIWTPMFLLCYPKDRDAWKRIHVGRDVCATPLEEWQAGWLCERWRCWAYPCWAGKCGGAPAADAYGAGDDAELGGVLPDGGQQVLRAAGSNRTMIVYPDHPDFQAALEAKKKSLCEVKKLSRAAVFRIAVG